MKKQFFKWLLFLFVHALFVIGALAALIDRIAYYELSEILFSGSGKAITVTYDDVRVNPLTLKITVTNAHIHTNRNMPTAQKLPFYIDAHIKKIEISRPDVLSFMLEDSLKVEKFYLTGGTARLEHNPHFRKKNKTVKNRYTANKAFVRNIHMQIITGKQDTLAFTLGELSAYHKKLYSSIKNVRFTGIDESGSSVDIHLPETELMNYSVFDLSSNIGEMKMRVKRPVLRINRKKIGYKKTTRKINLAKLTLPSFVNVVHSVFEFSTDSTFMQLRTGTLRKKNNEVQFTASKFLADGVNRKMKLDMPVLSFSYTKPDSTQSQLQSSSFFWYAAGLNAQVRNASGYYVHDHVREELKGLEGIFPIRDVLSILGADSTAQYTLKLTADHFSHVAGAEKFSANRVFLRLEEPREFSAHGIKIQSAKNLNNVNTHIREIRLRGFNQLSGNRMKVDSMFLTGADFSFVKNASVSRNIQGIFLPVETDIRYISATRSAFFFRQPGNEDRISMAAGLNNVQLRIHDLQLHTKPGNASIVCTVYFTFTFRGSAFSGKLVFNPSDPSFNHTLVLEGKNIELTSFNTEMKEMANVVVETGNMENFILTLQGNNFKTQAEFSCKYSGLKMKIIRANPAGEKEKKWLTSMLNSVINDNNQTAPYKVYRVALNARPGKNIVYNWMRSIALGFVKTSVPVSRKAVDLFIE